MAKRPGKAARHRDRSAAPSAPTPFPLRTGEAAIELQQLLKAVGAFDTGGSAKVEIQSGRVRVGGVVETRRSRRLVPGDVVAFGGRSWRVEAAAAG